MSWLLLEKSFLNPCCSLSGKSCPSVLLTGGCEVCPHLSEPGAQENLGFAAGAGFVLLIPG